MSVTALTISSHIRRKPGLRQLQEWRGVGVALVGDLGETAPAGQGVEERADGVFRRDFIDIAGGEQYGHGQPVGVAEGIDEAQCAPGSCGIRIKAVKGIER